MAKFRIQECWPESNDEETQVHFSPQVRKRFLFWTYWENICSTIYASIEGAENRIEVYRKFKSKNTVKELD